MGMKRIFLVHCFAWLLFTTTVSAQLTHHKHYQQQVEQARQRLAEEEAIERERVSLMQQHYYIHRSHPNLYAPIQQAGRQRLARSFPELNTPLANQQDDQHAAQEMNDPFGESFGLSKDPLTAFPEIDPYADPPSKDVEQPKPGKIPTPATDRPSLALPRKDNITSPDKPKPTEVLPPPAFQQPPVIQQQPHYPDVEAIPTPQDLVLPDNLDLPPIVRPQPEFKHPFPQQKPTGRSQARKQSPPPLSIESDGSNSERNIYQHVVPESSETESSDCDCPAYHFSVFGGGANLRSLDSLNQDSFFAADGGIAGAALGRDLGDNHRYELEGSYRGNDVVSLSTATGSNNLNGYFRSYSGMANLYRKIHLHSNSCFQPYIGAGLGIAIIDPDLRTLANQNIIAANSGSDTKFAYQFMAGVNYEARCNMDLFIEYRYFKTAPLSIDTIAGWPNGDYSFKSDSLLAGIRWKY